MDKLIWRVLMWMWVRRAKRAYGGPGERGELFNTACFQNVAAKASGQSVGDHTAKMWLVAAGYVPGHGGCHWFTNRKAAEATFPVSA